MRLQRSPCIDQPAATPSMVPHFAAGPLGDEEPFAFADEAPVQQDEPPPYHSVVLQSVAVVRRGGFRTAARLPAAASTRPQRPLVRNSTLRAGAAQHFGEAAAGRGVGDLWGEAIRCVADCRTRRLA